MQGDISYFDNFISDFQAKIWSPTQDVNLDYIILEGKFLKKSHSQKNKIVYLYLSKNYLYCAKKLGEIKRELCLSLVRLEIKQLGFKLTRNRKVFEFYTDNQTQFNQWKEQLIFKCFQTTFHEDFNVLKMIGKGGFAKVYMATKKENGKEYAVKAFNKQYMEDQYRGKQSIENEIKIMRKFDHDNIVKLYEVYETQNSVYLIIDLIQGGELLSRLKQTGFLEGQIIQKLMFNLMKALSHIHSKRCMHRDLKLENLLLKTKTNYYDLVIADFGLAACLDDTIIFKRCGTPGFVAPEVLLYQDKEPFYKENCDVFSAGIIFYFLIVGISPFADGNQKNILSANKLCQINYNHKNIKKKSPNLQDLLKKMLDKDPKIRISSEECLAHPYFQELTQFSIKYDQIKVIECEQYNDIEQQDFFIYILRSQQNLESMKFQQRQTALNGKTSTIETFSQNSNASFEKLAVPKQQVGQSKFSQYSQKVMNQSHEIVEGSRIFFLFNQLVGLNSPSNNQYKKQKENLHVKTIKKSIYQNIDDKLNQNFDEVECEIEDEKCQLQNQLKHLKNEQVKFLHGPDSPNARSLKK